MSKNQGQFTDLERAILKTLAFFDIFDYPLTILEIYKWLYQPKENYQLSEIVQAMDSANLNDEVAGKFGFYFLSGRQSIVTTRLERYQIAEKKFRIALRTVWFLRRLAFIKMIAICNNVSYNNATKESDIDFFIIISRGRLWWSRLVITLAATSLRVRRHDKRIIDRVCLSFYMADNHLNLADIALKPIDPYLVYWLATLAPIYDNLGIYNQLLQANSWLSEYLPNFWPVDLNARRQVKDNACINFSKNFDQLVLGGVFGDWLEKLAKLVQAKKIKRYFGPTIDEPNTNVVINSSMLKFHKTDRRLDYQLLWQRKLNSLGIL